MSANTAEQNDESIEETQENEAFSDKDTDNVGDASVELNVEELISALEADGLVPGSTGEQAAKRRLEELMEQRRSRKDLEDFDDYDL